MPATAAVREPPVVVLRSDPAAMLVTAKEVVVAFVKSEEPESVVDARTAERFALSWPPMLRMLEIVEEPVTASAVDVAP